MRYYKYPWKSATVILSSIGVLLCVVILSDLFTMTTKTFVCIMCLLLLLVIVFRTTSDAGELVTDARARWVGV